MVISSRAVSLIDDMDLFRKQDIGEGVLKVLVSAREHQEIPVEEAAAAGLCVSDKEVTARDLYEWRQVIRQYEPDKFSALITYLRCIWKDAAVFPISGETMYFENSWMFERTYGGRRGHEGTDVIPPLNISGCYPVVSMTDGMIENIGWLEQGGWRIGIRSPSGGYFYYAHLDSYEQEFQIGDQVQAGTVLGKMGDTGYGSEGTCGKFAVHLHVGIYLTDKEGHEISVNPYWLLRYLQYT